LLDAVAFEHDVDQIAGLLVLESDRSVSPPSSTSSDGANCWQAVPSALASKHTMASMTTSPGTSVTSNPTRCSATNSAVCLAVRMLRAL
jgi:hypothetical protein